MSYIFGNLAAWGIARCSINQSRSPLWFSVSYVTLIAAVTFIVGLSTDTIAVDVFIQEFLALAAVNYFIIHDIHCFYFFHARTSRNTRQTSRKGRNPGQNARPRRIFFYSFLYSQKFFMFFCYPTQKVVQTIY